MQIGPQQGDFGHQPRRRQGDQQQPQPPRQGRTGPAGRENAVTPKWLSSSRSSPCDQIGAAGHPGRAGHPLPAGALVAHPQHIAEEHAHRQSGEGHAGAGEAAQGGHRLPPPEGEGPGAPHGHRRAQRAQQVDEILRRAAQGVGLQIVAQHVVARKAQHQVDVQPVQPPARPPRWATAPAGWAAGRRGQTPAGRTRGNPRGPPPGQRPGAPASPGRGPG